jgi:hypothetical protein
MGSSGQGQSIVGRCNAYIGRQVVGLLALRGADGGDSVHFLKGGRAMEPRRREQKWSRAGITLLAPALAIFFTGFLIFQSGILRPGGLWLEKPDTGNVITTNQITLKLSAYSYTFLPLERVVVTYWHEGINPQAWNRLCVLAPRSDKTYMCEFDFIQLKVPVGKKILVSFEVYGILMKANVIRPMLVNYTLSPAGWGCFYWKQIDVGNPCGRGYP